MAFPRALGALAVLTGLLLACSPATEKPAASSAPANAVPNAAPAPACGDASSLLAGMSTRDKLAQLLMVGVRGADDARAVVDTHHVGGIMIGGWTDLSMMGDPLREIANAAGPLPLAVSADEEGGGVHHPEWLTGD